MDFEEVKLELQRLPSGGSSLWEILERDAGGHSKARVVRDVLSKLTEAALTSSEELVLVWKYAVHHQVWKTDEREMWRSEEGLLRSLPNNQAASILLMLGSSTQRDRKRFGRVITEAWGSDWLRKIPRDLLPYKKDGGEVERVDDLSKTVLEALAGNVKVDLTLEAATAKWREAIKTRTDTGLRKAGRTRQSRSARLTPADINQASKPEREFSTQEAMRPTQGRFTVEIPEDQIIWGTYGEEKAQGEERKTGLGREKAGSHQGGKAEGSGRKKRKGQGEGGEVGGKKQKGGATGAPIRTHPNLQPLLDAMEIVEGEGDELSNSEPIRKKIRKMVAWDQGGCGCGDAGKAVLQQVITYLYDVAQTVAGEDLCISCRHCVQDAGQDLVEAVMDSRGGSASRGGKRGAGDGRIIIEEAEEEVNEEADREDEEVDEEDQEEADAEADKEADDETDEESQM